MILFPTAASTPRPIRLSEATRDWAWRSMHGQYGDEAMSTPAVAMDDIPGFEEMSVIDKHDEIIMKIAKDAPIRICPEELLCGAGTLGWGIFHCIPASYKGKEVLHSISHLTIRYDRVVREGLVAYEKDIAARLQDTDLDANQVRFLQSMQCVIEAIRIWHGRYLAATKDTRPDLYEVLQQVPFAPARNFHEAMEAIWFTFAFTRLCGNWPGIGRLDWLVGDYLHNDLESGALTMDEAREIMASFFIKGCEWIESKPFIDSGDAQHYQNIVLGGIDKEGKEVTNEATYLALEVVEELAISDYPITVRLNEFTPESLKIKIAEVMRHGGGIVAVYNEKVVLDSFAEAGYDPIEARAFANDGCWEVQIPGETYFRYTPFDGLQCLNRAMELDKDTPVTPCATLDELYARFLDELRFDVERIYHEQVEEEMEIRDGRWLPKRNFPPCSLISLFEDDCIRNAASYYDYGTRYTLRSPHIGGAPDIANSLYAIEQLVFVEKKVSYEEMIAILRSNWEDAEALRQYVRTKYEYYGNDADAPDAWYGRVLKDFADIVNKVAEGKPHPVKYMPGVSTFGRQINWLPNRCATAFGYRKGDILAGNASPTPGTDCSGATAIIKSYCKADLKLQSSGAALDVKIFPDTIAGENGLTALVALMDGFTQLGGFFMQLDTVDVNTLREAQKSPQDYKTLSVRVSGWNARFVTLSTEWQNMIIERTSQSV